MAAVGYGLTDRAIIACGGSDSAVARAVGSDLKGKISMAFYAMAIPTAFVLQSLSILLYVSVILLWLVPDRRIERALEE
ncbi:hypothetical protein [Azospirillum sp. INR13]|uniref:hypothetical protein n=1 Tax=Azospirillum sp. INR13 TaxID=2596919 RepID=UPI0018926675|nr:hypothetical protein [Azospirillum sp. INR13]